MKKIVKCPNCNKNMEIRNNGIYYKGACCETYIGTLKDFKKIKDEKKTKSKI